MFDVSILSLGEAQNGADCETRLGLRQFGLPLVRGRMAVGTSSMRHSSIDQGFKINQRR
jgi:hypothetical protein